MYGQLGDGTTNNSSTPIKVLDNVYYVSIGRAHSSCITNDVILYTWGGNYNGKLGYEADIGVYEPKRLIIK